jgi:hypothetical protein
MSRAHQHASSRQALSLRERNDAIFSYQKVAELSGGPARTTGVAFAMRRTAPGQSAEKPNDSIKKFPAYMRLGLTLRRKSSEWKAPLRAKSLRNCHWLSSNCASAPPFGSEPIRLDRGVVFRTKRVRIFREGQRATSTRHAIYFASLCLVEVHDLFFGVQSLVS